MAEEIPAPPRSESFSVAELVADARRGRLRIPAFQRGLKWDAEDVALLFDSLMRGYPVGSLLLWKGPPAEAGPVHLGPLVVQDPRQDDVRWLVDGQQRVVSLAAALTSDGATGQFDLWFDPDVRQFHPRPRRGPETHWIEVWRMLDAADLGEFLLAWAPGTPERRRTVLDVGRRIREYRVPATVIEADDVGPVKAVFSRLNTQGKSLQADEIFDVWSEGGTLDDLAASGAALGWGTVERETLLGAVLVDEGADPTRHPDSVPSRASADLVSGLARAIGFLREDAAIPHLALLPYSSVLKVLPAFFHRHPTPSARTRTLLVRWVWRVLFLVRPTDQTLLRAAARLMRGASLGEDGIVEALLAATPRERSSWSAGVHRFRADSGPARIGMCALASLRPVDLRTGVVLDVTALFRAEESPIVDLLTTRARRTDTWFTSIANRVLHPPAVDLRRELVRWVEEVGPDAPALLSHALSPDAVQALLRDDLDGFFQVRAETLGRLVAEHRRRFAAEDQDDRPNLRELFAS